MRPALRRPLSAALALFALSCSPPPRPSVDGYSARVTIRSGGTVESTFRIAVRGPRYRRDEETPGGPVLILLKNEQNAYRLDPSAKTYVEIPYAKATDDLLPGFPLDPGFNDHDEAAKRGITEYRRESDEVFAGMVCALWRFVDHSDAVVSPSTVYWVAPSLENLTIRMDREIPRPDGTWSRQTVELTDIRVGVSPELFVVPKGFRLASSPH